jgi:hypothetical protein
MTRETPLDRLGRELETAAARQAASVQRAATPVRPRRWWQGRTLAVAVFAAVVGAGAAAWAATSLLSTGSPVPYAHGAPIAGRALGAPIPGTVRLLADDVPDPAGGPAWGLRYWETDRKYACVQVGRLYRGKLGQITADKVFHELRLGVPRTGLGGCFAQDGSGHAFAAIHTDALHGAQPPPCPTGFVQSGQPRGPNGQPIPCTTPDRTVDFGLLGPNARSIVYRAGGGDHIAAPLGGVGGYLIVQKHRAPVMREYGFHHRDPKLNLHGPAEPYLALTPASQVIKRVTYTDGTCVVHVTLSLYGACNAKAGFTPIPQPKATDVRAPIRAFAAPGGKGIRVRFTAHQAVIDGRSAYNIEVRSVAVRGFLTQSYSRNVNAGDQVRITVDLYNHRRGPYRIVVRYKTIAARPGPYASLASPGLLVGQADVLVP